ncbi:dGTPase [Parendozoicomonas haliclonae]|uniref:Deoxyguanosinetriphosphate triphosphohydrolase n=1 Tax=Parendozoicomonas haliclonae TaxID=1960125 RepID=A0A1X7AEJ6_9GAMM|nr:dGTPase [Parendozoicomonas haliclonae]SMA34721.1 Deoxyguanosinetriphosphate triphosphohydrolase [Parendozoicomonas haliclonae]
MLTVREYLPGKINMDYKTKITCRRQRPTTVEGRDIVEETESNRGRIIQSAAIRRLQQKTQVYPLESNAAVRSRLTHSLEVQQTGRFISRSILKHFADQGQLAELGLEGIETAFTNLVEMACLMHDVGNPPFGHFGEAAINDWMEKHGHACFLKTVGESFSIPALYTDKLLPDLLHFEGNAQGLRIIHSLQKLNLTTSQVAALVKYTRPAWQTEADEGYRYRHKKPGCYYSEEPLIHMIWQHLDIAPGHRFPLVYIMEAADDIAYCIADIEDAVDKGILNLRQLQQLLQEEWQEQCQRKDFGESEYLPDIVANALGNNATAHLFITRLRTRLVKDLVAYATARYSEHHQAIFDGSLDEPLIDGGSEQHLALLTLKWVARKHVFSQPEVETPELRGYAALMGLMVIYQPLLEIPGDEFREIVEQRPTRHFIAQRLYHRMSGKHKEAYCEAVAGLKGSVEEQAALEWYYRVRLLIDYMSGMTDNYVLEEYQCLSAI